MRATLQVGLVLEGDTQLSEKEYDLMLLGSGPALRLLKARWGWMRGLTVSGSNRYGG